MSRKKSFKLGYLLKMSIKGIFRNGFMTVASVIVLMSCLVVIGCFYVLTKNIDLNLDSFNGYKILVAYLEYDENGTPESTVADLKKAIESYPGVKSVEYVDRDSALVDLEKTYGADFESLFESFDEKNPLKDSFRITYESSANATDLIYRLKNTDRIMDNVRGNVDLADQIDNLKNIVNVVLSWLMVLLLIVSVFVIVNTIKITLFARRDEIRVMRYVGATRSFVAFPFLMEGAFIGIFSAFLAYIVQLYLYKFLITDILSKYQVIAYIPFSDFRSILIIGFTAIGVFCGLIGSFISLRKYIEA